MSRLSNVGSIYELKYVKTMVIFLAALLVLSVITAPASAANIYVNNNNNSTTVKEAMVNASNTIGDIHTIIVEMNTTESSPISIESKQITITAAESYTITKNCTGSLFTVSGYNTGSTSLTIGTTSGILTISGDNISADDGGLINVDLGTLTIGKGVNLTNGYANQSGGLIYINDGTLTIKEGANLTNGHATKFGGLIYFESGILTIEEGANLTNGSAKNSGGGVYLKSGTLTMTGGNIAGSSANITRGGGGGVYISNGCNFTMSGDAIIHGNSAICYGGAVYNNGGTFEMSGNAIIQGNSADGKGGAVYNNGMFKICNNANITADNDVYLPDGKYITRTGEITETGGVFNITPINKTVGYKVVNGGAGQPSFNSFFKINPTITPKLYLKVGADQYENDLVLTNEEPQEPNVEVIGTDKKYATVYNAVTAMDISLTEATLKILQNTVETTTIPIDTKKINITTDDDKTITKALPNAGSLFTVGTGSLSINATGGHTLTIDGNKSVQDVVTNGGLINVGSGGTLTLESGALLTNASANNGGGVYSQGTLTMTGGNITDNSAMTGSAVYSDGTFEISAGANVTADNDVYLNDNKFITQIAAMSEGHGIFNITPLNTTNGATIVTNSTTYSGGGALKTSNFILNKNYVETNNLKLELNENADALILVSGIPYNKLHNGSKGTITADLIGGGLTTLGTIELVGTPDGFTFNSSDKTYTLTDETTAVEVEFTIDGKSVKLGIETRAVTCNNTAEWGAAVGGTALKLNITSTGAVKYVTPTKISRMEYSAYTDADKITVKNVTTNTDLIKGTDYSVETLNGNINLKLTNPVYTDNYEYMYSGRPLGDVNNDGVVNIVDSAVIGIYTIQGTGSTLLNDEDKVYAKTDADVNDISVADLLKINRHLVGLP